MKISFTFCFSFNLISLTLCADPSIKNEDLVIKLKCLKSLLNEGIYAPSRPNFNAIL